jgi:hypothetical protein
MRVRKSSIFYKTKSSPFPNGYVQAAERTKIKREREREREREI